MQGRSRSKMIAFAIMGFVLAILAWISHYLLFGQYGFYEDDYWAVTPFINRGWVDLITQIQRAFSHWPQGRPLNHSMPMVFGWAGFHLGGINGIYLLLFVVLATNSYLVAATSRCSASSIPPLLAGASFIFYPADTTRLLITHGAHLHLALTYSLLGLLMLGSRYLFVRLLAYAIASLSLLSYETAYTIFAIGGAFYLLCYSTGRWSWIVVTKHLALSAVPVTCVALIRATLGESRVTAAVGNSGETLRRMLSSLWIGPGTSLTSYWRAWIYGLLNSDRLTVSLAITVLVILGGAILVLNVLDKADDVPPKRPAPVWLLICGASITIGSYGLTIINYPPVQTAGRLTSTHMAAGVGIALFAGGLLGLIEKREGPRTLLLTAYVMAFALAGTMPYLMKIQNDYAIAWSNQKEFWSALLRVLPDLQPDDVVLMAGAPPRETESILSHSWADARILRQLVVFEKGEGQVSFAWLDTSRLPTIAAKIEVQSDGAIVLRPEPWRNYSRPYDRSKTLLLEWQEDGPVRLSRVQIEGPKGLEGRTIKQNRRDYHLSEFAAMIMGISTDDAPPTKTRRPATILSSHE